MKRWTIVAYPECDEGYLPRQEREVYAKDWDEAISKAWDLWPEYHQVGAYEVEER